MLRKIVSISGKPGLYKVLSQGKNMLIVESLLDGKRMPAHSSEKVVSLGDISMFTMDEDKPLHEILEVIRVKENGEKASIDPKSDTEALRSYFAEIVPDFDRDRVYPTDIRKLIQWYNLLVEKGMTDFKIAEATEDAQEGAPATKEASADAEQASEKKAPAKKTTKAATGTKPSASAARSAASKVKTASEKPAGGAKAIKTKVP